MELRIEIPTHISDNFGDPLFYFINTILNVNNSKAEIFHFDFNNCMFINPFIIGGLTSIAHYQRLKGKKVHYTFNKQNESISNYFKTVYFPDGFNYQESQFQNLDTFFENYHSKTYIPLIAFPAGKKEIENKIREKVISAINSILKDQLKLKGYVLMAIFYMIDELTQNITDHSGSNKGILFAQFYPTKNFMDICIADYGKGLLQSYIDAGKHNPKSDEEAINFAIFGKSTKNLPESRGFGLSTSRRILVEGLKGKFCIYSGNAFFVQDIEREELIALEEGYYYKGCYVALRIPILTNEQFNLYDYVGN
ncbi:MAG: sensor histidine kinase [Bacteroidetes bacterium]|nr:sensor histidine kinase [Bacteroidota bacterium]